MDIDKELEAIFDDPLLNLNAEEQSLFDIPQDMRRVIAKKKPDYVAQHILCENFDEYKPLFAKVHEELKEGRRSLVKINKTATLAAGRFYYVSGQMLLLEQIGELKRSSNFLPDARTRCVYENGTESDILLQTLRKNVVGDGYAISELQEESESHFFSNTDIDTYLDETDGKRYLRRYDALRLIVGYNKDRESALVQVTDTTYNDGVVEYHLGMILEKIGDVKAIGTGK